VELWLYTTPAAWVADAHAVFEYGAGGTRAAFGLDMDAYPNLQFYAWGDDAVFDAGLPPTGWAHLALVYDGATTVRLYVNGALRTTHALGAPLATAATAGSVGHAPLVAQWASSYFPGRIDEVAVYGAALPPDRIAAHYAAGTTPDPGAPQEGYVYRGDGLRHSTTAGGVTTTSTWDVAAGLPVVLQDGTYSYVYGLGGQLVSQTDASGAQSYYLADGLGSTAALTDDAGVVTAAYQYDVFGAVRASTGAATSAYGFTGQQADAATGLVYLRARYYDPGTGRFFTKDPLQGAATSPQTQHRYAYAGNNPVNGTDPSGAWCVGVTYGYSAEGGLLNTVAAAVSISVGYAVCSSPGTRLSHGVFRQEGAFANWNDHDQKNFGAGLYVGEGFGFLWSDVSNVEELGGASQTVNVDLGAGLLQGSIQASNSSSGQTVTISPPGAGVGYGVGYSAYQTDTSVFPFYP
jgi:RHS repeat-associated protein